MRTQKEKNVRNLNMYLVLHIIESKWDSKVSAGHRLLGTTLIKVHQMICG